MIRILFVLAALSGADPAKAIDVTPLWDFAKPAVSEERFRAALKTAVGDDALILQTQIARTYMLRKDFARAREILNEVRPKLEGAGPEAQARYWLELGRSYASHQQSAELQTPEAKQLARAAFETALAVARSAHLDGLTIDALHMFVFVDTAPADQVRWNQEALALVLASDQAAAKRWEASIRSNLGEALYDLGRPGEALEHFQRAQVLFEQDSNQRSTRDAHWQVARTLRVLNRTDEALALQLRLEQEAAAAGDPKSYIFEELELLYRAKGDEERAKHYAERRKAASST
jgi:tetratricopeptide (TPR) repeat protein